MTQIKLFHSLSDYEDTIVNEWLIKNPDIIVKDIKISVGEYATRNMIMIIYEVPENIKTREQMIIDVMNRS